MQTPPPDSDEMDDSGDEKGGRNAASPQDQAAPGVPVECEAGSLGTPPATPPAAAPGESSPTVRLLVFEIAIKRQSSGFVHTAAGSSTIFVFAVVLGDTAGEEEL